MGSNHLFAVLFICLLNQHLFAFRCINISMFFLKNFGLDYIRRLVFKLFDWIYLSRITYFYLEL